MGPCIAGKGFPWLHGPDMCFCQAREVKPTPCTLSVPPQVPGPPGAEQTPWIKG